MEKIIIRTEQAPAPIGPYSQAVKTGNLLFISGAIALNPQTGMFENGDIETETKRVMENLKAILNQAGADFANVVKTTIFLSEMTYFKRVNTVYESYFNDEKYPARETVSVKGLPMQANVEISMIATL